MWEYEERSGIEVMEVWFEEVGGKDVEVVKI